MESEEQVLELDYLVVVQVDIQQVDEDQFEHHGCLVCQEVVVQKE